MYKLKLKRLSAKTMFMPVFDERLLIHAFLVSSKFPGEGAGNSKPSEA